VTTPAVHGVAAGDGAASRSPLIVRSRTRPILLFALGGVAVTALMVAVRSAEMDVDDAIMSAVTLALAFWLAAQSLGLLVRRSVAGHALRLDADGLHHPGWGVVPWPAIRGADLHRVGGSGTKNIFHLVLDIDPACAAPRHGSYVRWLFGPIEGLWRRGRAIHVPLVAIDAEPYALLAAVNRWRGAGAPVRGRA
jgi:hypothetical protein